MPLPHLATSNHVHCDKGCAGPYLGRYCEMSSTHFKRTVVLQTASYIVSCHSPLTMVQLHFLAGKSM